MLEILPDTMRNVPVEFTRAWSRVTWLYIAAYDDGLVEYLKSRDLTQWTKHREATAMGDQVVEARGGGKTAEEKKAAEDKALADAQECRTSSTSRARECSKSGRRGAPWNRGRGRRRRRRRHRAMCRVVCAWCLCLYKNEVNTVAVLFNAVRCACVVCAWCLCLYKNEVNTVAVFFSMPCGALCAFSFDVGNIILVRFLSDHSVELAVSGQYFSRPQRRLLHVYAYFCPRQAAVEMCSNKLWREVVSVTFVQRVVVFSVKGRRGYMRGPRVVSEGVRGVHKGPVDHFLRKCRIFTKFKKLLGYRRNSTRRSRPSLFHVPILYFSPKTELDKLLCTDHRWRLVELMHLWGLPLAAERLFRTPKSLL